MHPRAAASTESASTRSPIIRLLVMTAAQREAILTHLVAALPNEGVALVGIEPVGVDGRAVIARIFPGTNIEASPYRFTMDPLEVVMADREMRAAGLVLGAIVHSHVASPPTPSATDLREAFYPSALLVILSLIGHEMGGAPEFGAWRIDQEHGERRIVQIPIQVLTEPVG